MGSDKYFKLNDVNIGPQDIKKYAKIKLERKWEESDQMQEVMKEYMRLHPEEQRTEQKYSEI